MIGLGTIINVAAIIVGGILGLFTGGILKDRHRETLCKTCGISVMFLAIAGTMEGMLSVEGTGIVSGRSLFVVLCLVIGALIGEIIDIEGAFEKFAKWLKIKSGNAKDPNFVDGFLTSSFTVCIGAMAIIGAINDGIYGDYTILTTKAILDFVIVMVMSATMGKGCIFSAIPVAVLQGLVTALATFIKPVLTDASLGNLSMVGSILIFCVGVNLVWPKTIKVANLLPALIIAVGAAYLPF